MSESVGLAWYTTGTVTVTQGSTAVTGVGTNWVNAGLKTGDIFTIDRAIFYEIATVNSNTSITLRQTYTAASTTVANYYIIRNFAATLTAELSAQVSNLVAGYEAWKDGRVSEIAIPFNFSSLYKGVWKSGASYKALDIVMYNSALYVCTVAHTSSSSILPTNTTYWNSYAPTMPESIDVLNYNNAASHNALARSKFLGNSFTTAHHNAINAGTFNDLYIGDYWTFRNVPYTYLDENETTKSDTYSGTMRNMDINYFLRCGDTILTKPHCVVAPDYPLFEANMNDTNTTEGGYAGSKMRTVHLRRAEAIFKACFGADHVLTHREYLVNAVANGKPSGGAWYDSLVELMDERMVYGSLIFDSGNPDGTSVVPNGYSVNFSQLNAFRHAKELIPNGNFCWLRNVVSAECFANLGRNGNSGYHAAYDVNGVRPFAVIN